MPPDPKIQSLIALAVNVTTPLEEARTAALAAVKCLAKVPDLFPAKRSPNGSQRPPKGLSFKEAKGLGPWSLAFHVAHKIWLYLSRHPDVIISIGEATLWCLDQDLLTEAETGTFQRYLLEEMGELMCRGLVTSRKGRNGGYLIASDS